MFRNKSCILGGSETCAPNSRYGACILATTSKGKRGAGYQQTAGELDRTKCADKVNVMTAADNFGGLETE